MSSQPPRARGADIHKVPTRQVATKVGILPQSPIASNTRWPTSGAVHAEPRPTTAGAPGPTR